MTAARTVGIDVRCANFHPTPTGARFFFQDVGNVCGVRLRHARIGVLLKSQREVFRRGRPRTVLKKVRARRAVVFPKA